MLKKIICIKYQSQEEHKIEKSNLEDYFVRKKLI